ncbi:hypothetical protein ACJMK2_033059 [Sinanodonta woodiana]|uniref:Death domain-containing protein n=1 Tax=Sinanodonta woodiana TaxID=1069815 RepID=A0ABD3X787_SINWO
MGHRFPCRANKGWVYKRGSVCSKCDKCPGGYGRDTSKQVINTNAIYGDMECLECEVCPPQQYNNGGREGCWNCLKDCAQRNRHNCSYKATQPCGECFNGFFEDYQYPDDPSTCNLCTEKEIGTYPTCANFTTSTRAATMWARDGHNLARNITNTDIKKAVEMRNGHSADGITTRIDIIIALISVVGLVVIVAAVYVTYRWFNKRRERSKRNNHKSRNPQQSASACPLLDGNSNESVKNQQVSVIGPSSDGSVTGPSSDGSMIGPSADGSVIGPSSDGSMIGPSSDGSVTGPSSDGSMIEPSSDGKNGESPGHEIKVCIDDTDSAPENDSEAVPATIDPGRWDHRTELLRSKKKIWSKCAQHWTELGNEYQVLSIALKTVDQLKKEKEDKGWTNADFCYEILKSWTQLKGDQATVKALCDALFKYGHYELINTILLEDI